VAAGGWHSMASTTDGRLFMWGQAEHGQLGLGQKRCEEHDALVPVLLGGDFGKEMYISHIAAGGRHSATISMALEESSGCEGTHLHCFGRNDFFQCGFDTNGDPVPEPREIMVEHIPGEKVSISCGDDFTMCVTNDHRIWFWGRGGDGCSGRAEAKVMSGPLRIGLVPCVSEDLCLGAVACGRNHVVAWRAPMPELLPPDALAEKAIKKRKKGGKKKK